MMKVEGNTRGKKQRAPRGRGRGKRTNFQSTDLVVTVSNEDGSSRLKPPVTASQPRKIVLNRRTESTDLEKVTVKSLDEIKREKEQRQHVGSAHETTIHDSQQADGPAEDNVEDRNLLDTSSKPVKVEPSCPGEPVATTQSGSGSAVSNSSEVTSRPLLKKLTIPLKAIPALAPHHKRLPGKQPISSAISSPVETGEIDFDSSLSDQEFDYLDGANDSDLVSDLDEDLLLNEETETKQDPQMVIKGAKNHQDGKDANTNDGYFSAGVDYTVPLAHDYAEEEEDDTISLHPDDSLLDEEDEFCTNSNRLVRPRILGRRSGSESRDLRMMITDRQQQPEESSSTNTTTISRLSEELQLGKVDMETRELEKDVIKGNKSNRREKSENVSPKLCHRERDSPWRGSRRLENQRHKDRAPQGRSAQRNGSDPVSRRGRQRSRPGPRRESGSKVPVPSLLGYPPALPSMFTPVDGLLPLPVNVSGLSQVQAALEEKIKSTQTEMQMTVLQMLTNPPPVPGEHVPGYDQQRPQPPARHGPYGPRDSNRMNERHLPKRPQRNVSDAKNRPLMPKQATHSKEHAQNKVPVTLQKKAEPSGDLPNWLKRTRKHELAESNEQQLMNEVNVNQTHQESTVIKTGGEVSQYETTANAYRHDAVAPGFQNDCNSHTVSDVEKAGLARESHSPPDYHSEMQVLTSKRKSPFREEEVQRGGKIVIATTPEGLPQPGPAQGQQVHPKGYCFQQLDMGHCTAKSCKYTHLPHAKLVEYQRSMQSENTNSQDHLPIEAQPEGQMEQTAVIVQETQPQEEDPSVSYQLVTELLSKKNLRAAWQMIERLCRTNKPDFDILRRTLVVCSEHLEEPDIAAQVACQAFDMIGERNGQQHRHDYTVLIKTLCHSGQYIRAYEMLDVMKRNNHMPTYEVFLDLVQASAKDPDWAFNLLNEIKQSGLFKSGICSDLILLGCNSGEHFVERTWFLFQEALQSQVQISQAAFQTMLLTLSQRNHWEKIMSVIAVYPDAVPIEVLNTAVLTASRKADWVEIMIELLATAPAQKLTELGPDVWNSFLSNCCVEHASNLLYTQKIYSLMQQNGIQLTPQSINSYISALSHANNCNAALELFNAACEDPEVLQQPQVLKKGLVALTMALGKTGATVSMLYVVHFMLEHHIKPDDSVLQSTVESLDKEKNYKGIHQFFSQLEAAQIVPPVVVYRQIISSLEKWSENPTASVEPYMAMRHAYPAKQSDTSTKEEINSSDDDVNEQLRQRFCKFFGTPRGCFSGKNCKFLHPEGTGSFSQGSAHSSGGSTPGGTITGSITEKRPSNPFVLQGQGVQLGDIPSTLYQGNHQTNQMGSEALPRLSRTTTANSVPFTEMPNPGSSQVPFRAETSISSEVSFKSRQSQSQNQGNICHFFGTPQGCRHGDNCRFVHHQSGGSMLTNSDPTLPEVVPSLGNGSVGRSQSGNPFVFKDLTFSSGQATGAGLFEPAHEQQHTPTGGISRQVGFHLGGPFASNTWQHPAACPVSGGGSHHFQLAGASHFTGANPFSTSVPGRTRSMEDFMIEPRVADQNRQTSQSAPIVPEIPTVSHFQFPSRKSFQFYIPRIKHASEHQRWEDLGYVYVNMKNEEVEIDYDVLEAYYHAFEANCTQTVGECFEKFSLKIHHHLEQRMPNLEPDCSPSALLDNDDKYFLGQLGVALMHLTYSKQLFSQGYTVLHVLHNFSINYSLYSGEFGAQKRALTTTEVALTAADICLNINEPLHSSALEVLRGTNYALPTVGAMLTSEEAEWRRGVFLTLCQHFTSSMEFDLVYELLDKVGDIEVFGSTELKALYNALLCGLIKNNQLDDATEIFQTMVQNCISREPQSVRALVNGFGEAGRSQEAKRHFMSGVYSGVYPPIFNKDNPWTVSVGVSFSALESQFYIEKHLISLQEFIAQHSSGDGVLDDNLCRSLTVVIKSDEVPSLYTSNKYIPQDEIIRAMREKVCTVLTDDFNPPLSCTQQSKVEELVVSAMSLKCWFRANPATGRFKGGSFSRATSQASVAKAPPYLQPGMSNVVSPNGLEGEARRVSVFSKTDKALQGPSFPAGEYQQPSLTRKTHRGQRFVSSSSRKMSGSGLAMFSKFT